MISYIAIVSFRIISLGLWQGTTDIALKKLKNQDTLNDFISEATILQYVFIYVYRSIDCRSDLLTVYCFISRALSHPHVVRYLGLYEQNSEHYIVTEYLREGSVDVFVRDNKNQLTSVDLMAM